MATWLRRLVSKQKRRFQDGGFDLDLAYISPRIIAMGLPAQGREVLYRNPMQEIARFLTAFHAGRAKVYNLCSEHTYTSERLSVPLCHFPFDDHQTPPLLVVQRFCADAAAWLAAHPANVVIVHCKAGKGRTGLMICCLLLYLHVNAPNLANLLLPPKDAAGDGSGALPRACSGSTAHGRVLDAAALAAMAAAQGCAAPPHAAEAAAAAAGGGGGGDAASASGSSCSAGSGGSEAGGGGWHPWQFVPPLQLVQLPRPVPDVLRLYAERRTHDGNGVTIMSQRRYVSYFWSVLSRGPKPCGTLPQPRTLQLRQLCIAGLPHGTADSCSVFVEARPSGSAAPSATRVWAHLAPRPTSASMSGLCMVPCSQPPLVREEGVCTFSSGPHGDTLTLTMPAASMGLSVLCPPPARPQPPAVEGAADGAGAGSGAPDVPPRCCRCGRNACGCSCLQGLAAGSAAVTPADAGAVPAATGSAWAGGADDASDTEQAGCCVVEGDVRVLVMRGGVRLFYTWFHTAFLPTGSVVTLTRAQLDKPAKALGPSLSLTLRYVDMRPLAAADDGEGAARSSGHAFAGRQQHEERQQQEQEQQHGQRRLAQPSGGVAAAAAAAARRSGGGRRTAPAAAAGGSALTHGASGATEHSGQHKHRHSHRHRPHHHGPASKQQQQQQGKPAAEAAPARPTAAVARPQRPQRQQQQQSCVSAPASPQGGRLARSSSWRQHLPAISSLSSMPLSCWGEPDLPASPAARDAQAAADSRPVRRLGAARFSWDWDSLSTDDEACGVAAAAAPDTAAAPTSEQLGAAAAKRPGSAPAEALRRPHQKRPQAQQKQQAAKPGAAGAPAGGARSAQQPRGGGGGGSAAAGVASRYSRIMQDLHTSISSGRSSSLGALGSGGGGASAAAAALSLSRSPAAIELPLLKRPSGADSIVDALLDPEQQQPAMLALGSGLQPSGGSSTSAADGGAQAPPKRGSSWSGAPSRSRWQQLLQPHASQPRTQVCSSGAAHSRSAAADMRTPVPQGSGEAEPAEPAAASTAAPGAADLLVALDWSTDVQRYQWPTQQHSPGSAAAPQPRAVWQPWQPPLVAWGSVRRSLGARPADSPLAGSGSLATAHSAPATPATPVRAGSGGRSDQRSARSAAGASSSCQGRLLDLGHEPRDGSPAAPDQHTPACRSSLPPPQHASPAAAHSSGGGGGGAAGKPPALCMDCVLGVHAPAACPAACAPAHPPPPAPSAAAAASGHSDSALRPQHSAPARSGSGGSGPPVVREGSRDELLQGLLQASDGPSASCGSEVPSALAQWQQLEKAWRLRWV